jgi:hypothetical protein
MEREMRREVGRPLGITVFRFLVMRWRLWHWWWQASIKEDNGGVM